MGRTILQETEPFIGGRNITTYRLVAEEDGTRTIERSVTRLDDMETGLPEDDAEAAFRDFVRKKQASHYEKNRPRITDADAFSDHFGQEKTWREIADAIGQKSVESIKGRVRDLVRKLAASYMAGADVHALAADHDISANRMHEILVDELARQRARNLEDIEDKVGSSSYSGDVRNIADITEFLGDAGDMNFVIVDPFEVPVPDTNQRRIYTRLFVDFIRLDGSRTRIEEDPYVGLALDEIHNKDLEALAREDLNNPIVDVRDAYGRQIRRLKDKFATGAH